METKLTSDAEPRRASRLPYVLTLLFMGAVVIAAWVGRDNFRPVIAGEPAPGFVATTFAGDTVSLDDYRGKVVLVNVWATWCAPCREEMPSMQRLHERVTDPDFEILAVSVDASLLGSLGWGGRIGGNVQEFAEEFALTFPILLDPSGATAEAYHATALPESFVVGRDGIIYKKVAGGTAWDSEEHVALIERLLGS